MLIRKATGRQTLLVLHSRLNFVPFQHASPALVRLYSVPTNPLPSEKQSTEQPPLPLPPHKKPKIDLRPAPIKPKPPSSVPVANTKIPKSFAPPNSSNAHVLTTPKLGEAKEEALHDIHDAEAHGILEPPPPGANWFRRTLHQGIQLFKFYFRGVKLIFTRRKTIAAIKARISAGGAPLTRAEYRLIQTQKDDINKVIPFLIIALLLEEVIPLIAIYAPFMLPSTCILPSQRERIEAKRAEKAQAFTAQYRSVYADLNHLGASGRLPFHNLRLEDAPTAVCGLLGLSTIGLDILRMRRIRRHLEFITRDDQMLLRDTRTLSRRELTEALEERGIRTSPAMTHKDLQARLLWWLDAVKDSSESVDEVAVVRRLALVVSLT